MEPVRETAINLVSEGTQLDGRVEFDQTSRVHGVIRGEVTGKPGSLVILGETGVIEGNIHADSLIIDGYVKGDIRAETRVVITGTGRVIGNVHTPSLSVRFGAYFEGRCTMDERSARQARAEAGVEPSTVSPT